MNKFKTVIPLLNRVLVRKLVPEAKTAGGIILNEKSLEKEARVGVVVSVGPGSRAENGQVIPVGVKVGDHVLLPEYSGMRLPIQEENEYMIYKDTELLAVLDEVRKV